MLWSKVESDKLLEWQAMKSQDFETVLLIQGDTLGTKAEVV